MKTLQIASSGNAIVINYLTDLIGTNDKFTIYQIKTLSGGVETIGASDAAIQAGFFYHNQKSHTLVEFINFCKIHAYTLKSFENTATGSVTTTIWSSGYGDGGAIGENQL